MSDGDILASFRHLSAVLKIAWHAHDGFQRGDIVWRLGGRRSDFDFADDPYPSGPGAPALRDPAANGHILIYDNGSVTLGSDPRLLRRPGGPDRADHRTPAVAGDRVRTRHERGHGHVGLELPGQRAVHVLRRVRPSPRQRQHPGRLGRRTIGHGHEVSPQGTTLWELKNDAGYLSYRVIPAVVPDVETRSSR